MDKEFRWGMINETEIFGKYTCMDYNGYSSIKSMRLCTEDSWLRIGPNGELLWKG
jgi:hypothetical protein